MKKKIYDLKIKLAEVIYLKYFNQYKYFIGKNKKIKCVQNKKKVVLTLTPRHGNLGDHAIAYASKKFIQKNFVEYEFIELDMEEIYENGKALNNMLNEDDIIMTLGGGNMGDLYNNEEWTRRFIIKTFTKCKIISLPQTISFSNTTRGNKELKKTQKIYNTHENLTIIAREKKSFKLMQETFGADKVLLTPDIVLSLDKRNNKKRAGIVTCLRSDLEKSISDKDTKKIFDNLKVFGDIKKTDTILKKKVLSHQRDYELNKIWDTISGAEVVITDRLHGMIFCAITATPCIVLRNSNHKIEESYKAWLSDLDYIRLINSCDIDNIANIVEELKIKNLSEKKFIQFDGKFNLIKEEVTNL